MKKYPMRLLFACFLVFSILMSCGDDSTNNQSEEKEKEEISVNTDLVHETGLQLDDIELPAGFKIDVFARVEKSRSLALSPDGTLFVSTRADTKIYALKDTNGDMKADEVFVIASDLTTPNGVAFKDGDLYVAQVSKIWKYGDIENNLSSPPSPTLIKGDLPTETHHGWKYIAFGPDGKLYIPIGAPCNICESDEIYASIYRMDPDGTGFESYASGVRNTVGMTWHPDTDELWFTDNGRDWLGDDSPQCELNRAATSGLHFGYPYCHSGDIVDPGKDDSNNDFSTTPSCDGYTAPAQKLGPHVAPLGLKFGITTNFPSSYGDKIFIAEHGSWNRSEKIGYQVSMVTENAGATSSYTSFASGWLIGQSAWGRPVDLVFAVDGSMLVSDDLSGTIYRIWHE